MSNEQLVLLIQKGEDKENNIRLLWEQNQGLIQKLSCSFCAYAEKDDLEQEGFIGLCNAAEKYDSEQGAKFSSYAAICIKQRMSRYIRNNGTIRIPEFAIDRLSAFYKMSRAWKMEYNRKPTDEEVMEHLDLSRDQLYRLKEDILTNKVGSLDVPAGEDEGTSMYELLPGEEFEERILDKLQHEQLKKTIWSLVDGLPGQQPEVIRERYQKGKTLEEVGQLIGVNRDRARTIEYNGLRELRKPSRANSLRPFLDEYIYSSALTGTGLNRFRESWTSSTERVVLNIVE